MKTLKITFFLGVLVLLGNGGCNSTSYRDIQIAPSDTEYIVHAAKTLSAAGPRKAGFPEEANAARFIMSELNAMGITPYRQEFKFQTFEIEHSNLIIGGMECRPDFLGINPYTGPLTLTMEALILEAGQSPETSAKDKLLISNDPDLFFMALQMGSAGFVSLKQEDFDKIKHLKTAIAELNVEGEMLEKTSANIIVKFGKNSASKETLWYTAHYDSYMESPGANDNGTGVGGLLALAKKLKSCEGSLPYNVRLLFLGAEEVGLVGSRAFVQKHGDELENCKLLINFDTFGGNEAPYIATAKGVEGVIEEGEVYQTDSLLINRALEGPTGQWRLFDEALFPLIMCSNYPEWVQAVVDSVANDLSMTIYNSHLLSDHLVFARAGVPSISIQSREHTIHSVEDTVENINEESVEACFQVAWGIAKRVFEGG